VLLSRHRGAHLRSARSSWPIFVLVKNASLENGLLHVDSFARFRGQEAPQHSDHERSRSQVVDGSAAKAAA